MLVPVDLGYSFKELCEVTSRTQCARNTEYTWVELFEYDLFE